MTNAALQKDGSTTSYTIMKPQEVFWQKRSDVVDHILDNADETPSYSQIVELSTGAKFNLLGERLHIFTEDQWSQLTTLLTLCFLSTNSADSKAREAVSLMLRSRLNDFLATLPQSHQDEVVERAHRLLNTKQEDKPIEDLLEPKDKDDGAPAN